MRILPTLCCLVAICAVPSLAAHAQSRPERTYQNIDGSIVQQQRQQQRQQQNQFETNQLRQDIQRNQLFVPPPSGSGIRGCTGVNC